MTTDLVPVCPAALDELAAALADLPPLGPWITDAACGPLAGADIWTADDEPDVDELAVAERVCRRCPVRGPCADYAGSAPVHGVWGGVWHGSARRQRNAA